MELTMGIIEKKILCLYINFAVSTIADLYHVWKLNVCMDKNWKSVKFQFNMTIILQNYFYGSPSPSLQHNYMQNCQMY